MVEWPPFGKELFTRLTVCSLCTKSFCNSSHFPVWFRGQDLNSDRTNSWLLLSFFFWYVDHVILLFAFANNTDTGQPVHSSDLNGAVKLVAHFKDCLVFVFVFLCRIYEGRLGRLSEQLVGQSCLLG